MIEIALEVYKKQNEWHLTAVTGVAGSEVGPGLAGSFHLPDGYTNDCATLIALYNVIKRVRKEFILYTNDTNVPRIMNGQTKNKAEAKVRTDVEKILEEFKIVIGIRERKEFFEGELRNLKKRYESELR